LILSFGTLCLDRVYRIPQFPRFGGYIEAIDVQLVLGGEAANTALALRSLGVPVRLHTNPVGNDEAGRVLTELAKEQGIEVPNAVDGFVTPATDVYVTPDGERTMIGAGFSAMDSYEMPLPDLAGVSWLSAEPNMPNASKKVVSYAQDQNVKTYLMDFFKPEQDSIVSRCDVWQSSTDWVGARGDAEENLRWVEGHSRRYGCATILTDGARGLYAASKEFGARAFPALKAIEVVDTTGAGDVFRAGVLAGLHEGLPLNRAMLIGAAAAALASTTLGATTDLPSRSDVDKIIAKNDAFAAAYA